MRHSHTLPIGVVRLLQARRFLTLVDALYDYGAKLHCSMEGGPRDLFLPLLAAAKVLATLCSAGCRHAAPCCDLRSGPAAAAGLRTSCVPLASEEAGSAAHAPLMNCLHATQLTTLPPTQPAPPHPSPPHSTPGSGSGPQPGGGCRHGGGGPQRVSPGARRQGPRGQDHQVWDPACMSL